MKLSSGPFLFLYTENEIHVSGIYTVLLTSFTALLVSMAITPNLEAFH
jgi:hypothetical protein